MIKLTKKIDDIIRRDKRVFLTTTRVPYPFVADRGEGDFAYDVAGNKFIDFTGFIAVYNLGVNTNAAIRKAIKLQVDKLMHSAFLDYYSELPVNFAESLVKMFPAGFGKVFLSNSGTEANEAAMKFAKLYTKRQYIIAFYNSFHGRTLGTLGMTSTRTIQREHFGPFNSIIHAPYPYPYRCPFDHDKYPCGIDCIEYLKENILEREVSPDEVAAIFVEPIQGEGGYVVPPQPFMKELRNLTKEHGMLLISDEVQSGYMRTGKFLAMENFGVTADIYTMAKAIGGGLPLGATVVKSDLGDIPAGSHANTFGGNHVAMAAAYASIKYVMKNKRSLEEQVKVKNKIIMKRLHEMQKNYEIIGDVRGIGLMIGFELVKDRHTKEPAVKEREEIVKKAFNNGLLLLEAGKSTIRIAPPITISVGSIEKGLDVLEESIRDTKL